MRRIAFLLALVALPATAGAQWQIGLNVGARTRPDGGDGNTVFGIQFEGMIVKPAGVWTHFFQGAVIQMKNHNALGERLRENSIEVSYLLRRQLVGPFGIAVGPALGYSTGCASGGRNSTGNYGATPCVASFAEKGTKRPGYNLQLDYAHTTSRGISWRWGVRATGHTVASGSKDPKPVVWAGVTAPLNSK